MDYAGDVTCIQCFQILKEHGSAQLIDVRTRRELELIGMPSLKEIDKAVIAVEWQQLPDMQINPEFISQVEAELQEKGCDKQSALYFLCRSGARSIAAAEAMTRAGYTKAYNVLGGFEGKKSDASSQEDKLGWMRDDLPIA